MVSSGALKAEIGELKVKLKKLNKTFKALIGYLLYFLFCTIVALDGEQIGVPVE